MSQYSFKTCTDACTELDTSCPNKDCRSWINFEEDLNCAKIAADKHGPMTLREVSKRIGCSFVRVKQLEEDILKKLKKQKEQFDYLYLK